MNPRVFIEAAKGVASGKDVYSCPAIYYAAGTYDPDKSYEYVPFYEWLFKEVDHEFWLNIQMDEWYNKRLKHLRIVMLCMAAAVAEDCNGR